MEKPKGFFTADLQNLQLMADDMSLDRISISRDTLRRLLKRLEMSEELNGAWEDLEGEEIGYDDLAVFKNRWRESACLLPDPMDVP